MNPKQPLLVLLISTLLLLLIAFYNLDKSKPDWFVVYIGVAGSIFTVTGLGFVVWQVYYLKKESEIIKSTSKETIEKITLLANIGDFSHGIKLVQEIQGYIRSLKHELSVARLQELKIALGELKARSDGNAFAADYDKHIQTINLMISGIERDIAQKRNALRTAAANSELEIIMDFLVKLKGQHITRM